MLPVFRLRNTGMTDTDPVFPSRLSAKAENAVSLTSSNANLDQMIRSACTRASTPPGVWAAPTLAHDMLLTPSHDEAAKLAQTLTSLNDERRSEEDRIYKEALEQAEANPKRLGFVLYGKDWHQGVIGIVASRIVEVYYRPVLILCSDGESLKGSGRSVPEFDLHAGLTRCADMLLGFGGHRQAAGAPYRSRPSGRTARAFRCRHPGGARGRHRSRHP